MKTVTLKLEGMRCEGCANTVKGLLEREPGVRLATVSYEEGEARVLYDPQIASEDRIVAAAQRLGHRVVGRQ